MTLALSAKAFSVSAPSEWNSLTYNCRSAELHTFRRNLKSELFDIAYSEREHSTYSLCHLCASDSLATYGATKKLFWLILTDLLHKVAAYRLSYRKADRLVLFNKRRLKA